MYEEGNANYNSYQLLEVKSAYNMIQWSVVPTSL